MENINYVIFNMLLYNLKLLRREEEIVQIIIQVHYLFVTLKDYFMCIVVNCGSSRKII